jgi:ribonuclease VapC
MQSKKVVLDASALIAWLYKEPGADVVLNYLEGHSCVISTVNLAEVITRASRSSQENGRKIAIAVNNTDLQIIPFSQQQAEHTGLLEPVTRTKGLSLGDRACLSLAVELQAVVLTSDKVWQELNLPIEIVNIRAR